MGRLSERLEQLSPLQRAVYALKETQAKLETVERARTEPIAIIGMACRFPGGANSPESFWKLLRDGVDAIREVPADRWNVDDYYDPDPAAPGKTNSRWGGFLDRIDGFDKTFFGISEREAVRMDPQQRLLMELAWEAIENAGMPADRLAGTRTGVYIGISGSDYCLFQVGDPIHADAYSGTGTALCIASNRISFAFDFRGPSVSIDTACSSSLVAVQQACQSLRSGESNLALAGGVTLMLWPTTSVNLTKASMSSPDGHCRSFDARANGYVRGEGAGLVVLKPLSAALKDGDPIHAVIRGVAVNQDGRSNGIKSPNRQAQEAVLREAYAQARVAPGRVQYVEAQGTGTVLGDLIEAQALGRVLSTDRPAGETCAVGSVKTNIGHLEPASGIAGLIKVVLALKNRQIPPSLHCETPNPYIPFDELRLRVQRSLIDWPQGAEPAVAGISAFGFGGTNAHVVIEEAPRPAAATPSLGEDSDFLLPLSARTETALADLAVRYRDFLASETGTTICGIAQAAATRREHQVHRLAVVADSRDEAMALLDRLARAECPPEISRGRAPHDRRSRVLFVFPARLTASWRAFGRTLRDRLPVFRKALTECDQTLRQVAGWEVSSLLDADEADLRWNSPLIAEPALLALQLALVELWRTWGITPATVAGEGVGEIASRYVAGTLTKADAFRIASGRPAEPSQASTPAASVPILSLRGSRDAKELGTGNLDSTTEEFASSIADAIDSQKDRLPDAVLEVGPSVLSESLALALKTRMPEILVLPSLAARAKAGSPWLDAMGRLFAAGCPIDWNAFFPEPAPCVRLPSYPWQRERCWIETDPNLIGSDLTPAAASEADSTAPSTSVEAEPARVEAAAGEWLYELQWMEKERPSAVTDGNLRAQRRWLLLSDSQGVGAEAAARLTSAGDECTVLACPERASSLRTQLAEVLDGIDEPWDGIIHLASLEVPSPEWDMTVPLEKSQALACGSLPPLLHALGGSHGERTTRVWIVTRGALALGGESAPPALLQAPIWGLSRTLAREQPDRWGGLLDLDPDETVEESAARIVAELISSDNEDQVAFRRGQRLVPRLVRPVEQAAPASPRRFRSDAAYLVTGGFGGIGGVLARWLVEHGARRLILLGRTRLPERIHWNAEEPGSALGRRIALIRALEGLGASVHVAAVDVADEAAMARFLATYEAEGWPPIRGVFHLAGSTGFSSVMDLEPASLEALLRPKLSGGWNLHKLLSDSPIEDFVLFSSASSVLGSPFLGGYAAASAALDALAEYRRAHGKPALAIDWGAWSSQGMTTRPPSEGDEPARRRGIKEFSAENALGLLDRILAPGTARVIALPYTGDDWVEHPPIPLEAPLLSALELQRTTREVQPRPELKTPFEAPGTEFERWLAKLWADVLRIEPVGIHDDFFELGGDSLQGAVLLNRLQSHFEEIVQLMAFFETPNVGGLAAYLRRCYPEDVKRLCPSEQFADAAVPTGDAAAIVWEDVAVLRRALASQAPPRPRTPPNRRKNRRAVFILSPPRSGSTLLRVMLAGHTKVFAPPELFLLQYETLAERRRINEGADAYRLEGSIRALMEIHGWDTPTARQAMRRNEESGMTTQEFYGLLQDSIGGRLLVDKTPNYALERRVIERAEEIFEEPLYIHLLRHPCGMIRSYDEYRLGELWGQRIENPYTTLQQAEIVWVNHNANILEFLETVPAHRAFSLPFEELVGHPEASLRALCGFLELDYVSEMAQPYEGSERRMLDGITPESRMLGDQKLVLKHKTIDPATAHRWADAMTTDFLGPAARDVAARLGYEDIPAYVAPQPRPQRGGDRIERSIDPATALDQLSDDEVEAMLARELAEAEARHG